MKKAVSLTGLERAKREYIRHPSDIPIFVSSEGAGPDCDFRLNNVSVGGLAFRTAFFIAPGDFVTISIDVVQPSFTVKALVQWCHQVEDAFEIGAKFSDKEDAFRARMVEQVCHIEHYRQLVWRQEKRNLSGEEAAAEWIEKYAHDFPQAGGLS